jgi:cell division protein FtsW
MKKGAIDKPFLLCVLTLMIVGFFIFSSASLGLLAGDGDKYQNVAFSQTFYGLFLGSIALLFMSRVPYKTWKTYSFYFFIASLVLTALVFVPGFGFEHGGATRWISLFGFSFQPSEILKITFIMYFAAWLSSVKDKVRTMKYGVVPLILILSVVGGIILSQPDTDTFILIAVTGFAMFLVSGGTWKHVGLMILIGVIGIAILASVRPYVKDRLETFINPADNALTSSYQIQQSLIGIGSGGMLGRGFGQSIQKFNFLPEPIGDSIFAVAAEEFGFVGSVLLIALFVFFSFRGLRIAAKTEDSYGRLLVVGIVILIIAQSFLNIGAMLGVLPLTGNPLPFVSHGGTALLLTLAGVGIILNVSKSQTKS